LIANTVPDGAWCRSHTTLSNTPSCRICVACNFRGPQYRPRLQVCRVRRLPNASLPRICPSAAILPPDHCFVSRGGRRSAPNSLLPLVSQYLWLASLSGVTRPDWSAVGLRFWRPSHLDLLSFVPRRWRMKMRRIEQYKKMAAENERLARAVDDETFRTMYSKFARQWREAAQRAEIADPVLPSESAPVARGTAFRLFLRRAHGRLVARKPLH
jgi:hypothetical protein